MAGKVALGGRRRRGDPHVRAKKRLMEIGAAVYEDGDTQEEFARKVRGMVKAEAPAAKTLLQRILEMFLPFLFELITRSFAA